MNNDIWEFAGRLGLPLALLVLGYVVGSLTERAHYKDIKKREEGLRDLPAINFRRVPKTWSVERAEMAMGSVVISVDYFKRFLAALRGLVGGPVHAYESLLDRARREAILRLKENAKLRGFNAVTNVRLENARIASALTNGKGTSGIEVIAYGTALVVPELKRNAQAAAA